MARIQVGIVGCGPVGAVLANLLGGAGVSVLVLDGEDAPYDLPRAMNFDAEVMRGFQAIGLADEIAAVTHLSPGMRFLGGDGRVLVDWARPTAVGPQGWPVSYRFHQPELEGILVAGLVRFANVELRRGCELLGFEQSASGVALRYVERASGAVREAACDYLVGCDGARSMIRKTLGVAMEDLEFHEPWLVVDVILNAPRPALGAYSLQFCGPPRPATYVRGVGMRRRWEIALLPGETPEEMVAPARIWPLLARWLAPDEACIERAACYVFRSLIARDWRVGRVLLAGDAAHQTPPFLGQGLCAGVRDAVNLGWKLRDVVRRGADAGLLDSYGAERIPHVRDYIALAVKMGRIINGAERPVGREGPVRMESIVPDLGPGLVAGWAGPAGRLAPQPVLAGGARLDDRVGYEFVLHVRRGVEVPPGGGARGVVVERGLVDDWLDEVGAIAAMVRPDRYVLGAARDEAELAALCKGAVGVENLGETV